MEEFPIDGDLWWCLTGVLFLLWAGWLNAAQTAAVTLPDSRLKKLSDEGNKAARRLSALTDGPTKFLASLDAARIFLAFCMEVCAVAAFADDMAGWFAFAGQGWSAVAGTLLALLISSLLYLIFGYGFPRLIGGHYSERIALAASAGLRFTAGLFTPLRAVCETVSAGLARLFGVAPGENDEQVTEEEIRLMVDVGQEKGVIEDSEKAMINNVFEFDDRIAAEVMTHRTEICAVEDTDPLAKVLQLAIDEGYSRLPVYREDIDTVIGVIYVKDLLKYVGRQVPAKDTAESAMRPPFFAPESISCSELFRELTGRRIQMAVIVDEYGGTAGLVTIEDLLESIVGNMRDEFDDEEEEFIQTGENTYEADGGLSINDLSELLDTELPEGEYDTLGGLLLARLGRFPEPGEKPCMNISGFRFTIIQVDNLRIAKVLIERLPEPDAEDSEEKGGDDRIEKDSEKK